MGKIYCYVDESGLDVGSVMFIVAVVITGDNCHELAALCQIIERETGKHPKWKKSSDETGIAFIQRLFYECDNEMQIYYAIRSRPDNFINATADIIVDAILTHSRKLGQSMRATVLYDGLARSKEVEVGARIRRQGAKAEHVRGIADDHEQLIRVADAICGLVRESGEGKKSMQAILKQGLQRGFLVNLQEV